jgi:hypothetical protein
MQADLASFNCIPLPAHKVTIMPPLTSFHIHKLPTPIPCPSTTNYCKLQQQKNKYCVHDQT